MATITPNDKANFSPTDGKYSGVKPFRAWVQMALPQVYNDALSYQELAYKVLHYLNELINDVNTTEENVTALLQAYNQLQTYVNDYFDTLDVQEEIDAKLDAYVETGELQTIIDAYLKHVTFTFPTNIFYPRRIFRKLFQSTHITDLYTDDEVSTMGYCLYPQGMCAVNFTSFILAYCDTTGDSDYTLFEEVYMDGETKRKISANCGHANSLCYIPSLNYVCVSYSGAGSSSPWGIRIYDYDTFTEISDILQSDYFITSIGYDSNIGLYATIKDTIYLVDIDEGTFTEYLVLPSSDVYGDRQTTKKWGDYWLRCQTQPDVIQIYDAYGTKTKEICPATYSGIFAMGEIEDIEINTDGTIYIWSAWTQTYLPQGLAQMWEYNIVTGGYLDLQSRRRLQTNDTVVIDASSTSLNPLGNSTDPFPTLADFRASAYTMPHIDVIQIYAGTYEGLLWLNGKNIRIQALGTCRIGGIRDTSGGNITIIGTANYPIYITGYDSTKVENPIYKWGGHLHMSYVNFTECVNTRLGEIYYGSFSQLDCSVNSGSYFYYNSRQKLTNLTSWVVPTRFTDNAEYMISGTWYNGDTITLPTNVQNILNGSVNTFLTATVTFMVSEKHYSVVRTYPVATSTIIGTAFAYYTTAFGLVKFTLTKTNAGNYSVSVSCYNFDGDGGISESDYDTFVRTFNKPYVTSILFR